MIQGKNIVRLLSSILAIIAYTVQATNVSTNGGIQIGKPGEDHWFKLGGVIKLDEMVFVGGSGGKGNDFKSGANLRDAALDFQGGLGPDFSYTLGLNFDAANSKVSIDDAYVSYLGINKNTVLSFGNVNPGFSIESASSSKWLLFLERSLPVTAFGATPGFGVSVNNYTDNYALIGAFTQPRAGDNPTDIKGETISRNDRWDVSLRGSYAFHLKDAKIFQVGMSGYIHDDGNAAARFKTGPEAKARNLTETLDTGKIYTRNHRALGVEAAHQDGPFYAKAEYIKAFMNRTRVNNQTPPRLRFGGYHVQCAYVLTGESRKFNPSNGTFTQVVPSSSRGAWEIAGRYSFINLNNEDINGGTAHNTTFGVNYYVNRNIKVAGEYIYSSQYPGRKSKASSMDHRRLGALGLRLQVVF